jgi:hypothetical protein
MPIEVPWSPVLFTAHSGIRYAVCGSVWVEVPADTTRDDLPKYMVVKPSPVTPNPVEKTWKVEGSKGNVYKVRLFNDQYTCTCAGFGWRRKCRHIEGVK